MTIADDYINNVLDYMPRATPKRSQIAMELRGHIAERIANGQPVDEVLRQLGDPVKFAESYLSAEPLVSAPFMSRVAAKIIDAVCVLAVVCPLAWLVSRLVPAEFAPVMMIALAAAFCSACIRSWPSSTQVEQLVSAYSEFAWCGRRAGE